MHGYIYGIQNHYVSFAIQLFYEFFFKLIILHLKDMKEKHKREKAILKKG